MNIAKMTNIKKQRLVNCPLCKGTGKLSKKEYENVRRGLLKLVLVDRNY